MKKSLEEVQKEFGVPREMGIEEIAKGGSLLPMIIEDKGSVVETIQCVSISGGQNEINDMPAELTLVKHKWIDGELHEFSKRYVGGIDMAKGKDVSSEIFCCQVKTKRQDRMDFYDKENKMYILSQGENKIKIPFEDLIETASVLLDFGIGWNK
jgi:hypothetical protein